MGELVGMDGVPVNDTGAALRGAGEPPDGIRAFDQDGREVIVPREQWRTQVLPGILQQVKDDPDQTYMLIVNSLQDGFLAEVVDAAEHLYRTDAIPARGACLWGIVLLESGRLDEAEAVLGGFGTPDGSVLTNLAKVYAAKGDAAKAEATLWHAIELDPNLENAAGWYVERERAQGRELKALERLAALPGSWRARLWLARHALLAGDIAGALASYRQALQTVGELNLPAVPVDFLMQMSGDLGGAGRIAELVEYTAPNFVAEMHGLPVGNNLIKAYTDLGNLDAAAAIVGVLSSFERLEWKQALAAWEHEISRLRGVGAEMQIGMLRVDGPVWLPAGSPGRQIFGDKQHATVAVTLMGGTAEGPSEPSPTISDRMGRLSRALPLFLAEQADLRTAVQGRAMLPWAVGKQSGFVLSGAPWNDEQAVAAAAGSPGSLPSTYVVSVHIDATAEPWTAELAFVRMSDGVRIGELDAEFPANAPEDGLPGLADEMVELLGAVAPSNSAVSGRYVVPGGAEFTGYLLRLEQLLAVRCASMDVGQGNVANAPQGERPMLDDLIAACERMPDNLPLRLLLIETMSAMHRVKPEVVEEYREKVDRFMTDRPIAG